MTSLANAAWVPGNDSGTYTTQVDKLLIHTTEGGSIEGAVAAYRANNSWPHVTVDARYGHFYRVVQHLDFDVPARALRNESGGVQTNRDGVVQFEVVGYATLPAAIDWVWLGVNVFGPTARMLGIPVTSSVAWVAYPASYGKGAPQRLSAAQWTAYSGFLGHQHVPENSHGDPGAIPIAAVLAAAGAPATPTPQEDTMSAAEVDQLKDYIEDKIDRTRPFLAKAPGESAVFVVTRDGTKRWVDTQAMFVAVEKDGARCNGFTTDGKPLPFTRSEEHLRSLHTVGPVPDGWE